MFVSLQFFQDIIFYQCDKIYLDLKKKDEGDLDFSAPAAVLILSPSSNALLGFVITFVDIFLPTAAELLPCFLKQ